LRRAVCKLASISSDGSPDSGTLRVAMWHFSALIVAVWSSHGSIGFAGSMGVAGRFICLAEIGLNWASGLSCG